jgi:hypothetical protein
LEHETLMSDQKPMARDALRLTTRAFTLFTIAAWFLLSNHCALGVVAPVSEPAADLCPMHSAPVKKKPASKTPCCKDLRAVVAKYVAATSPWPRLVGERDYVTEFFAPPRRIAIEVQGLDTGPPGYFSFAESVLQESMLSHAPPLS